MWKFLNFSQIFMIFDLFSGTCPQWEGWSPNNRLENATEAMNLADEHLGIAQVCILNNFLNNFRSCPRLGKLGWYFIGECNKSYEARG